ncbi:MAG: Uma2 family endonuclease [Candidatus Rokuibacteriota bacterium]
MARPGEIVNVALTYADYCQLPNDGRRYEVLDGELAVTPAPTPFHQEVVVNLLRVLDDHVRTQRLGKLYVAPIDVVLAPTTVVQPDLVFVPTERLSAISGRGIEGPPDLVVEVLSPTTEAQDRGAKLQLYLRFGVPHYWLIDPESRRLESYERTASGYRLIAALERSAAFAPTIFPGLAVQLDALWPQ